MPRTMHLRHRGFLNSVGGEPAPVTLLSYHPAPLPHCPDHLDLRFILADLLPRSQTLFGNALRETLFRAQNCIGDRHEPRFDESERETEFRGVGSQTEFGNQMK